MKKKLFTYIATALLLWTGAVPTAMADTTNPEKYFKILNGENDQFSISHPYIDYEYADYDFNNVDDAFKDIEIGIEKNNGTRVALSTMYRCHDEMQRKNQEWGLMRVVKTYETGELRIVQMRYYPSEKAIDESIKTIYLKGFWDCDDDGPGDDHDKNLNLRGTININRTFDIGQNVNLDFDGEKFVFDYSVSKPNGFSPANAFGREAIIYTYENGTYLNSFDYTKNFANSSNMRCELTPKEYNNYYAVETELLLRRFVSVPNGSYGMKDASDNVWQGIRSTRKKTTGKSASIIRYASYVHDELGRPYFSIQMNAPYTADIDFYDNNKNYLGRAVTDASGKANFTINTQDPYCKTNYYLCTHEKHWPKKSFQNRLSIIKDVEQLYFNVGGSGTAQDPYLVQRAEDFKEMSLRIKYGYEQGAHWQLKKDVDMTDLNNNKVWYAIGSEKTKFNGIFDGNGHTITMNINANQELQAGLFGVIKDATIKNLKVTGNITTSAKYGAGLACRSYGATFENCEVGVNIISSVNGDGTHGGFVGVADDMANNNSATTYFKDCVFNGSIRGKSTFACGGFVGWAHGTSRSCVFTNCLNLGTFDLNQEACEVLARNNAVAENCYYLNALGGNKQNATQLTDQHKYLALMDQFGATNYCYRKDAFPALALFAPTTGTDHTVPNLILDGNSILKNTKPHDHVDVMVVRPFKPGKRFSITLPFTLTAADAAEWGKFYKFKEFLPENGIVVLTQEEGDILANQSYYFEPRRIFDEKTVYDVTLAATADMPDASQTPTTMGLVGTYEPIIVPTGAYGYSAGDVEGGPARGAFVRAGQNVKLPAFCAYLWLGSAPAGANKLQAHFLDGDGNLTGIGTLERDEQHPGIYTLDGRKLDRPQHGVNIINGKKVYLK